MRILGLIGVLLPLLASAQAITVTLDVQPRTFTAPAPLTVSWNSTAATTCNAGGDLNAWAGSKATNGTEQIPGSTGTYTLTLSCSGTTAPVTVSWTNPTKNTDGSDYTNAKAVEVYRAATAGELTNVVGIAVNHPGTSYVFNNLPAGMSHFATRAVPLIGEPSALSASVSKDVVAQTAAAAPVIVTGSDAPPTGVVSISSEGYAVKANTVLLDYELDGLVGTVQIGAPCDIERQMNVTNYYAINRQKYVTWLGNRRPNTVVVQCAAPQIKTQSESAPVDEDFDK